MSVIFKVIQTVLIFFANHKPTYMTNGKLINHSIMLKHVQIRLKRMLLGTVDQNEACNERATLY